MKDSIMKKFIESKWLFDEFMIFKYNRQSEYYKKYYGENKPKLRAMTRKWLENNKEKMDEYRKNYYKDNKERVYTYIPNWSKELQKERNEDIVRMRAEWKTLREIGDKKWISYEMVRLVLKRNTK